MTFTQKLLIITVPLLVLAVATYETYSMANGAGYQRGKKDGQVHTEEDSGSGDSPIIVGNGSIHIRQSDSLIHQQDNTNVLIDLVNHQAVRVRGYSCVKDNSKTAKAKATCTFVIEAPLKSPWKIELRDGGAGGSLMATLKTVIQANADWPALLALSTVDASHAIGPQEGDNGDGSGRGDGFGFPESSARFDSAIVTSSGGGTPNTQLCQNKPSQYCLLKISYCDVNTLPANCDASQ